MLGIGGQVATPGSHSSSNRIPDACRIIAIVIPPANMAGTATNDNQYSRPIPDKPRPLKQKAKEQCQYWSVLFFTRLLIRLYY